MDMFQTDFADKYFDVVFSQGALEHYFDEDIVRALTEQKRITRIVIINVSNARGKVGVTKATKKPLLAISGGNLSDPLD